jgi:hypothetical protein
MRAIIIIMGMLVAGCAGIREDGSVSFEGWRTGRTAASGYVYTTTRGQRQRWAVGEMCKTDRSVPCLTSLPR